MIVFKAMRLALISYLACVVTSLYLPKDALQSVRRRIGIKLHTPENHVSEEDDSPTMHFAGRDTDLAKEWTYPILEDGTRAIRNQRTGETVNITLITDASLEEARARGFPSWDEPDAEMALAMDPKETLEMDFPGRDAPDSKRALTKRLPINLDFTRKAESECHFTHKTSIDISVRVVLDLQWRSMKVQPARMCITPPPLHKLEIPRDLLRPI